jgi:class 3 adenylate cyclase
MPEERKLVTILFADVTGSTTLGDTLDPEDVRALMARYYEHARQVVADYGGTLEKFIGDAVMAVFGLPQAHGDDAERALAAALALRTAVGDDALLGERLLLRMGINTGEVVATRDPSRGDFLVTGDAVNVTFRLQQSANPGEILVSERTAGATQAAFFFGRQRLVKIKGKGERARVLPLTCARTARRGARPPLVGRRQDLLQLALLRTRALEERQPQLVSIIAPAGTGKTRLLEEFLAQLDPSDGFEVATARCPPYGQTLTYWPLRGLLNGLLGDDTSPRAVAAVFLQAGHAPDDAARLASRVLATLGIEHEGSSDAVTDREAIFNAWRLLVEALARRAPRIVVFEDLHWASDSLLDLVEHIMHPRTQAPLLIVVLSRPELLDRRPMWGGGRQSFTALSLRPLSEEQTRELVGRLMEGLPATQREHIVQRAGGNPFFAIELARGLAERVVAGEPLTANDLPDTVHAAVLARLDLLAANERAVLQAAAVGGRVFHPAALRSVLAGMEPEAIATAVDGLLARDLIAPAEGGLYAFQHILFREVAYGTLSRAERVRMHAATAAWLEEYAAGRLDENTELIAYHYHEAVALARQSAVPLALPIDPARAVHFLARAGELAGRSGAFVEARSHLQSAIALAPEADQAHLLELLGDCVYPLFGETAVAAYRQALDRWRATGGQDALVGARLLRKLLIACVRWGARRPGDKDLVRELAQLRAEARRLAEAAGDEDELWRVRVADLFWPDWRGDLTLEQAEAGRPVALAAAAHFEARGDWAAFSEALDAYCSLSLRLGDHRDALEAAERRLAAPELPAAERGDVLTTVARAHFNLGDYERCMAAIREPLLQIGPGESVTHLSAGASLAACAAWYIGRWDELGLFTTAVEQAWEQSQHEPRWGLQFGYFVALHVALAREDHAAADAAVNVLERLATPDRAAEWNHLILAYRDDDVGRLLEPARRLRAWSITTPFPEVLMFLSERGRRALRGLLEPAAIEARTERIAFPLYCVRIAEALAAGDDAALAAAIDAAEGYGMIPHAARMRIVLARRTGDRSQLERARPTLERLGDRQFLRRLEEVAADLPAGLVTRAPVKQARVPKTAHS